MPKHFDGFVKKNKINYEQKKIKVIRRIRNKQNGGGGDIWGEMGDKETQHQACAFHNTIIPNPSWRMYGGGTFLAIEFPHNYISSSNCFFS